MSILSTTLCFPNPARPSLGIFVQRRLAAIHEHVDVRVVAPVPTFPVLRPRGFVQPRDHAAAPPVDWPPMWYLPGAFKTLDAWRYAAALEGCIRRDDRLAGCGLIDAHFVWPDGVGAQRVARKRGLPFICTIRGKLVSQSRHAGRRRMIAEMLGSANALIAVSNSLADLARDVAGRDLSIAVIPNGVGTQSFHRTAPSDQPTSCDAEARSQLGWPSTRRHVVAVGHLQRIKGFHRLIRAWPLVLKRCDDARLILVGGSAGDPAYERQLRADAARVNASQSAGDAVSFAGARSPDEIRTLLNAADCFALASDSEGWCNAIAEALACGCPVVATDVGGNREIIHDPSLGSLAPLDDAGALASAIADALSRDWNRHEIAIHGGRRSWQQVAAECVDVYKRMLQ